MAEFWIALWIVGLCIIGMGSLIADMIVGSPEENLEQIMFQIKTQKQEHNNLMNQSDGSDDNYDYSDNKNYFDNDDDKLFESDS